MTHPPIRLDITGHQHHKDLNDAIASGNPDDLMTATAAILCSVAQICGLTREQFQASVMQSFDIASRWKAEQKAKQQ